MEEVYVYAGNIVTGEIDFVIVQDDEDCIEYGLDFLREKFGEDNFVWATYPVDDNNADVEFNNFMEEQYNEWIADLDIAS